MASTDWARAWRIAVAFCVVVGLIVIAYPHVLDQALERLGVRGAAASLLVLASSSLLLPRRGLASETLRGAAPVLGVPLLLLLAAISGDRVYLLLVPAVVQLALAGTFEASLRREDSLIERMARFLIPAAPEFIRPYCRKLTRIWVAFFVLNALVIAGLAVAGPVSHWKAWTGWIAYALMLVFGVLEFFVRKSWFRYYLHGGPFDRLWARLFPPEKTAAGRRSQAYIEKRRAELAEEADC